MLQIQLKVDEDEPGSECRVSRQREKGLQVPPGCQQRHSCSGEAREQERHGEASTVTVTVNWELCLFKEKLWIECFSQLTDRTILIKDPSGQILPYEVVGSNLRESVFKKSVPILHPAIAVLFCLLNVFPGKYYISSLYFQTLSLKSFNILQVLEHFWPLSLFSVGQNPLLKLGMR